MDHETYGAPIAGKNDVAEDTHHDAAEPKAAWSSEESSSAVVPPSLPTASTTFGVRGIDVDCIESSETVSEAHSSASGSDEGEYVEVRTPERKKPLVPPDLFENVAKSIEEVKHKMSATSSASGQASTVGPRRGSDFLQQVKKDFSEASQDIGRATHDVVSSASAKLRPKSKEKDDPKSKEKDGTATKTATTSTPLPSSTIPKPALKIGRQSTTQEHAHSFHEHSYKAPTYCQICNGLLVGLWSQGFRCEVCHMNVHRGEGLGDHDDCKAEAMLAACPGPDAKRDKQREEETAKLGDVIAQIRELANNPNFIKEVTDQLDKDVKARAKDVIVEAAVDGERSKNLKRMKEVLVPFVYKMDAIAENGEIYALMVLLGVEALATIVQTVVSFGLFIAVLAPRHGLTTRAFQLAAMHVSTVTGALHTVLSILASIFYYLSSLFKRKTAIIDRFLRDAFRIDAEVDIGVSVASAAERAKNWSKRILRSSLIASAISFFFWHHIQPTSWEAAALPPVASIFIPALVFTLSSGAVAYISYTNAPPEVMMDDYVDVKEEIIMNEIDTASKLATSECEASAEAPGAEITSLMEEEDKEDNAMRLQNALNELVPDGAIMD